MRIALISDIHGNLPALEAVMDDMDKRQINKVICLGDMVGKGPNSKEVINICQKKCSTVLMGNWEEALYEFYIHLKSGQPNGISSSILWYINNVGEDGMDYMGKLPHSLEFYLSGKLIRLFHAHPMNFNRYFSDSPIEQRLELFAYGDNAKIKQPADVAVYADLHIAFAQIINGKQLLNIGSIGNPLDICQASYVILEGDASENKSSFNVQFVRVPYDITQAVLFAKQYDVPDLDGYISELETAKYFG